MLPIDHGMRKHEFFFFFPLWSRAENVKKARGIFFPEEVISKISWSLSPRKVLRQPNLLLLYIVILFHFSEAQQMADSAVASFGLPPLQSCTSQRS